MDELKVLTISTSLKDAEDSETLKLAQELVEKIEAITDIDADVAHIKDYDIPPGVEEDLGDGDEWPGIADKLRESDIVIFSTPIWWGNRSSLMQRVIERMNPFTDKEGFATGDLVGKVAGIIITGAEDGGQAVQAGLMEALNYFGFALPPFSTYYELGGKDPDRDKRLSVMAKNLVKYADMYEEEDGKQVVYLPKKKVA